MTPAEFADRVSGFYGLPPREKIRLFAWYLHTQRGVEFIDNASIRRCFDELDITTPDVSVYLPRMAEAKSRELLRVPKGYKLEGSIRREYDAKYGLSPSSVAVSKLLTELPMAIPNLTQRSFLAEAIDCYRVKAYRASIVMAWNLAFDHLLNWIMLDPSRLASFNNAISIRFPKKSFLSITRREDFEEIKEAEVIDICRTAKLITKGQIDILQGKLKRRNSAAHPSSVVVGQPQADDAITDLVNNIVLALK